MQRLSQLIVASWIVFTLALGVTQAAGKGGWFILRWRCRRC